MALQDKSLIMMALHELEIISNINNGLEMLYLKCCRF
jgi:hypothetical protein